jgi:GAF domain-containing protein
MNTPSSTHDDLDRQVEALLASPGSAAEPLADGAVEDVLHALRERLQLDVVFVAEFVEGQRVFRFVDRNPATPPIEAGAGNELEASFCVRVVDGRLPGFIPDVSQLGPEVDLPAIPFAIGTHLGTPVVLDDGRVFGTLCCFSLAPVPLRQEQDMATLRQCARLVARKLERAAAQGLGDPPPSQHPRRGKAYASPVWKLRGAWDLSADAQQAWLDS